MYIYIDLPKILKNDPNYFLKKWVIEKLVKINHHILNKSPQFS